jgi:hypothetical protein
MRLYLAIYLCRTEPPGHGIGGTVDRLIEES